MFCVVTTCQRPPVLRSTRVPTHSRDGWLSASYLHLAVDPEAGVQDGDVGREKRDAHLRRFAHAGAVRAARSRAGAASGRGSPAHHMVQAPLTVMNWASSTSGSAMASGSWRSHPVLKFLFERADQVFVGLAHGVSVPCDAQAGTACGALSALIGNLRLAGEAAAAAQARAGGLAAPFVIAGDGDRHVAKAAFDAGVIRFGRRPPPVRRARARVTGGTGARVGCHAFRDGMEALLRSRGGFRPSFGKRFASRRRGRRSAG